MCATYLYIVYSIWFLFLCACSQLGNRPLRAANNKSDKERKIGHRRVGEGGEITYKKIQTSQIMGSIQLGIQHTVSMGDILRNNYTDNTIFNPFVIHRSAAWPPSPSVIYLWWTSGKSRALRFRQRVLALHLPTIIVNSDIRSMRP